MSPEIQILHIGSTIPHGLPEDVLTIPEVFSPEFLLETVSTLIERRSVPRIHGAALRDVFSPAQASTE